MQQDVYAKMVLNIIDEQAKVIGPIAYDQASRINGLTVNKAEHTARVDGDGAMILSILVDKYKSFFGSVAVDVCKDAIADLKFSLPPESLPTVLR